MATIKFLQPFDLDGLTVDEAGTPTVTAKRVTIPLVDEDRLVLTGRFDQSSDEAFERSTFTKLSILDGAAGSTPLVAISGFEARVGDIGDFATFLADLTRGADKITGSAGDDDLVGLGGEGNDRVAGGAGSDRMGLGAGRDILLGGDGDDLLLSGGGGLLVLTPDGDVMTGGRGADSFLLSFGSAGSVVTDFRSTEGDKLAIDSVLIAQVSESVELKDILELRAVGSAVELSLDILDGNGPQTLATIKGDLGTDLDRLLTDGVISFNNK